MPEALDNSVLNMTVNFNIKQAQSQMQEVTKDLSNLQKSLKDLTFSPTAILANITTLQKAFDKLTFNPTGIANGAGGAKTAISNLNDEVDKLRRNLSNPLVITINHKTNAPAGTAGTSSGAAPSTRSTSAGATTASGVTGNRSSASSSSGTGSGLQSFSNQLDSYDDKLGKLADHVLSAITAAGNLGGAVQAFNGKLGDLTALFGKAPADAKGGKGESRPTIDLTGTILNIPQDVLDDVANNFASALVEAFTKDINNKFQWPKAGGHVRPGDTKTSGSNENDATDPEHGHSDKPQTSGHHNAPVAPTVTEEVAALEHAEAASAGGNALKEGLTDTKAVGAAEGMTDFLASMGGAAGALVGFGETGALVFSPTGALVLGMAAVAGTAYLIKEHFDQAAESARKLAAATPNPQGNPKIIINNELLAVEQERDKIHKALTLYQNDLAYVKKHGSIDPGKTYKQDIDYYHGLVTDKSGQYKLFSNAAQALQTGENNVTARQALEGVLNYWISQGQAEKNTDEGVISSLVNLKGADPDGNYKHAKGLENIDELIKLYRAAPPDLVEGIPYPNDFNYENVLQRLKDVYVNRFTGVDKDLSANKAKYDELTKPAPATHTKSPTTPAAASNPTTPVRGADADLTGQPLVADNTGGGSLSGLLSGLGLLSDVVAPHFGFFQSGAATNGFGTPVHTISLGEPGPASPFASLAGYTKQGSATGVLGLPPMPIVFGAGVQPPKPTAPPAKVTVPPATHTTAAPAAYTTLLASNTAALKALTTELQEAFHDLPGVHKPKGKKAGASAASSADEAGASDALPDSDPGHLDDAKQAAESAGDVSQSLQGMSDATDRANQSVLQLLPSLQQLRDTVSGDFGSAVSESLNTALKQMGTPPKGGGRRPSVLNLFTQELLASGREERLRFWTTGRGCLSCAV